MDTADDLMEVANKNIDKFIKDKKKGDEYEKEVEKAFALKNEAPVQTQGGSSELIRRTKNYLLKPQFSFEPRIDNSYFQFVPLITHKDNGISEFNPRIKQLQKEYLEYKKKNEKLEYNPEGSIAYTKIPNPYEDEINAHNIEWTEMIEELSKSNPKLPPPISETEFQYIDKPEQIPQFIEEISEAKEIAVDLEFHSYRSYQGFTWLMQLSTRNKDFVIDTISLRSHLNTLNSIFTNPKIVKILHGSRFDIQWLQKDFGIYVVNLFDTGEAAKTLGLKASLAFLLKHYCDVDADKQYQLADWRQRPLSEEMIKYAREDTHYLHYIYDVMRKELMTPKNSSENPLTFLKSVWKASKQLCLQSFQKPKAKDTEYYGIMARNATLMGEGNLQILDMLLTWRDYIARVEDESIKFVMPNDVLFDIAKTSPKNITDLEIVLRRHPKHTHHELIIKYQDDLIERINKIIKDCTESIQSRVKHNVKKNAVVEDFSSSSSSSEDNDNNPNHKIYKPKEHSVLKAGNISIQVSSDQIESQMYQNNSISLQEEKNKHKIDRFMTKTGIHTLLGISSDFINTKREERKEDLLNMIPQNIVEEDNKMELDQERKDIVIRVEEIPQKSVHIVEQDMEDNINEELPKSIGEKYNIKIKNKRERKSNKRFKIGEDTEKIDLIQQNKQTVMNHISEIAQKVKDNITNNEIGNKKEKKRNQKEQIRSRLGNKEKLNPEKWEQMINSWEKVVNRNLSGRDQTKSNKNQKKTKIKHKPNKGQKKNQNRFSFLDSH